MYLGNVYRNGFETFECNGVILSIGFHYVPVWICNSYSSYHKRKNAEWKPFSINNIQNTVNCIYYWDYLSSFNPDLSSSNFSDTLFNFSVVASLLSGYMISPSVSIYGLSG